MFETFNEAEIKINMSLYDSGTRLWQYIIKWQRSYWFYITYEDNRVDLDGVLQLIFIENINYLIEFCLLSKITVIRIDLVSSGNLNNSDGPKMERLKEIWCMEEPDINNNPAYMFSLYSKKEYVCSFHDTPEDKLIKKEIILTI